MELNPIRPEPIVSEIEVVGVRQKTDLRFVVQQLFANNYILIDDFYSTGLNILAELKRVLKYKYPSQEFAEQRKFRAEFRKYSQKIVVEIVNNKINLRKAPEIGWLKILYPEIKDFILNFTDIQGLNSSWQWYEKGLFVPSLNKKIFPFYGTYFPTRFEHIELFDKWLKSYKESKKTAIEIGVGSGILSFLLLKHNFEKVVATDINPNAIISVNQEIIKNNLTDKLVLHQSNLFEKLDSATDLIIFNPPWLPQSDNLTILDEAIYYPENLFERFFEQANQHLSQTGKIVLLFSNLGQIVNQNENPFEKLIEKSNVFYKEKIWTANVKPASTKTKRNQNWRENEKVELWIVAKKNLVV